MFTKKQTVLALIFVLIFGAFSACQENKNGPTLSNDLVITVTPDQTTIPIYGYLRLTVTISNPSAIPVKAHKRIGQGDYVHILIKNDTSNKFNRFDASWLPQKSVPPPPPEEIVSGTDLSAVFILSGTSYNDKSPIFAIPGKYEIKASFQNCDSKTYWESDIVNIQVQEPSGDDKKIIKDVEEQFKSDLYKWVFFGPLVERFTLKHEDVELLTRISGEYPESRIGRAALCGKAFLLARGSEAERKEAVAIFETLSNDDEAGFSTDCRIKLANMYMEAGDHKRAKIVVDLLIGDNKISKGEGEKILIPKKKQKKNPDEQKDKPEDKQPPKDK